MWYMYHKFWEYEIGRSKYYEWQRPCKQRRGKRMSVLIWIIRTALFIIIGILFYNVIKFQTVDGGIVEEYNKSIFLN